MPTKPQTIIKQLGLEPHPEGGWYRETWRADTSEAGRAWGTAIYFLLARDEVSRWHRIDAAEIWHFYAGAALELSIAADAGPVTRRRLGPDLDAAEAPQLIVPPLAWQSARSLGDWTLVGCTVSPGFEFNTFELAEDGWRPGGD
jgi:predicted cupin superfamily sugar epimerase